jgi:hypothetical protein
MIIRAKKVAHMLPVLEKVLEGVRTSKYTRNKAEEVLIPQIGRGK